MTPQTCITTARQITNDNDSVLYRQSNDELLEYFNEALKAAAILSPTHFHTTGDFTCEAGQTEQAVDYADAQELVSVIRIKDGKAVHPMDLKAMQAFNPDWSSDTADVAQNWAKIPGEKLRFYIYPKSPSMQVLEVGYIRNPAEHALEDVVLDVPEVWEVALANYIIYRAESKDDEHVNSGRAVASYETFVQLITG